MTAKRFNIEFDGYQYFLVIDEVNERCLARLDTRIDALAWLEMYKMLSEEIEQLQQELFESEKECIMIDYRDNPIRRNDKIIDLKEEYKERFGRDFE